MKKIPCLVLVAGLVNSSCDDCSNENIIDGGGNLVFGKQNVISGKSNAIKGSTNTISGSGNTAIGSLLNVAGDQNQLRATRTNVKGSSNIIHSSDSNIKGSGNVIAGAQNDVFGDKNILKGQKNALLGSTNVVSGKVNRIDGNQNKISGSGNKIKGDANYLGDFDIESRMKGAIDFRKLSPSTNWDCADCSCADSILAKSGCLNAASSSINIPIPTVVTSTLPLTTVVTPLVPNPSPTGIFGRPKTTIVSGAINLNTNGPVSASSLLPIPTPVATNTGLLSVNTMTNRGINQSQFSSSSSSTTGSGASWLTTGGNNGALTGVNIQNGNNIVNGLNNRIDGDINRIDGNRNTIVGNRNKINGIGGSSSSFSKTVTRSSSSSSSSGCPTRTVTHQMTVHSKSANGQKPLVNYKGSVGVHTTCGGQTKSDVKNFCGDNSNWCFKNNLSKRC